MPMSQGRQTDHERPPRAKDARELFAPSICAMDCRPSIPDPLWGVLYFGGVRFPDVSIFRDDGVGHRTFIRTRQHIIDNPIRDFALSIPLRARSSLLHAGQQTSCGPGRFSLLSSAIPFSGSVTGVNGDGRFSSLIAWIPGAALRALVPGIDDSPNLSLPIRPGASQMMRSFFELALTEGPALTASQGGDFGRMIVRSIANALLEAPELDAQQVRLRQPSMLRVREKAKEFILLNLSNPALDIPQIAAHCEVSERYLRSSFASIGMKVSAYVRVLRLQQCRAALQNPSLRHRTIVEIAMSWGFDDPTAFSRAYKTWVGKTPREDRTA